MLGCLPTEHGCLKSQGQQHPEVDGWNQFEWHPKVWWTCFFFGKQKPTSWGQNPIFRQSLNAAALVCVQECGSGVWCQASGTRLVRGEVQPEMRCSCGAIELVFLLADTMINHPPMGFSWTGHCPWMLKMRARSPKGVPGSPIFPGEEAGDEAETDPITGDDHQRM